ncbi:MAG: hypothetical protein GIW99_00150 [Candidatus Eremiobacteraeota bacterium]|nr:hypothetical protein [Candidatus Eremiobacteraeota bacterium]MBC5826098.1 hypothetical protein [Candidatus Eremiobacteraeota bacterium]
MLSALGRLIRELTADDVLHIDPVNEYERRQHFRELADWQLRQGGDENDDVVTRGRPTGP